MARKEKSNGHKTETPDVSHIRNVEVTHETSDVNVRAVLTFCTVLAIATIAVSFGIWMFFGFLNQKQEREEPKRGPLAQRELPPEPRLQGAPGFQLKLENGQSINLERTPPQMEYRELRKQWEQNLKNMAIDDAMKKIVSQGLPTRGNGAALKFEDYAISLPTSASSGRETERKLQ